VLSNAAATTLNAGLTYTGAFVQAAGTTLNLAAAGDKLTLTGPANLAGTISGPGMLVLDGGLHTFNPGATLTASSWSILGGTVQINENLTYTGTFSIFKYGFLSLFVAQGDTLALTDAVHVAMPKHSSGWRTGTYQFANATLAHDVVIGGTATLSDIGTMDETDEVVIGDKGQRAGAAILSIAAGAVYRLDTDDGIFAYGRVSDHAPSIINSGLLIKTAGTSESVVWATVLNNGTIEAAVGWLGVRTIIGDGSMVIDPGATLSMSTSAASLTMRFNGGDARLVIVAGTAFASTISDFAPTDTIVVVATADAATLGPGDTLVITNAGTAVATLQLVGDYSAATFNVSPDKSGGTDVTVTFPGSAHEVPAPTHQFIAAMAGLGGSAGGTIHTDHATPVHEPMLFKPRAMIA
jgi:hypothetical protein